MQEMFYSATLAQSYKGGEFGSDPFMKAMLSGSKETKDDPYSIVAQSVGIKRNQAKGAVLGALYGMGKKGYIKTLLNSITDPHEKARVEPIAGDAYKAFKGVKGRDGNLHGGLASNFFNYSARNTSRDVPLVGPFHLAYPKTLCPKYMTDVPATSALNYAVQAGCALNGMLSVFMCSMQAQCQAVGLTNLECKYSASIHDCLIYIVKKSHIKEACAAMVRAYIQTWAFTITQLGLTEIPKKFMTDIIIDVSACIRKDAFSTVKTPGYEYNTPGYQVYVNPETGTLYKRTSEKEIGKAL